MRESCQGVIPKAEEDCVNVLRREQCEGSPDQTNYQDKEAAFLLQNHSGDLSYVTEVVDPLALKVSKLKFEGGFLKNEMRDGL